MLTFFYFGTSSGMVFKLHQCLESISIFTGNSDKTCDLCKSEKKKDCCKTHFKILKTSDAQKADLLQMNFLKHVALLPKTEFSEPFSKTLTSNCSSVQINAPPEKTKVALFIRDCNFRI